MEENTRNLEAAGKKKRILMCLHLIINFIFSIQPNTGKYFATFYFGVVPIYCYKILRFHMPFIFTRKVQIHTQIPLMSQIITFGQLDHNQQWHATLSHLIV